MDFNVLFFLFLVIFILHITGYKICKEEKLVKNIFELYGSKNLQVSIFIMKAALGLIPVKNTIAIWICRIIYVFLICFFVIFLIIFSLL